jgi:hypothetical protein
MINGVSGFFIGGVCPRGAGGGAESSGGNNTCQRTNASTFEMW